MAIVLPKDSRERIRAMLAVLRGETVTFERDGVRHTLTPGPWVSRKFPTGSSCVSERWVMDSIPDDEKGKVVANAICRMVRTNPDDEANARLIAAAPDLLAACEAAMKACQDNLSMYQYKNEPLLLGAYDACKTAIAKAKGTHNA